jgi:hypothetical protein
MSTPAAPSSQAAKVTTDTKLARLFGLQGESWLRHANPVSVWTRFAVLPLLAVSIWSRDWIGWWSLVPIALSLVFMVVNPLLFPKPASTRNWASKGVFGERIWADRNTVELPDQFRNSRVANVTYLFQLVGMAVLAYGLVELDLLAVVARPGDRPVRQGLVHRPDGAAVRGHEDPQPHLRRLGVLTPARPAPSERSRP